MSETLEVILKDDANDDTGTKTFDISDGTYCRVAAFSGRGTPDAVWSMETNLIDHGGYPTRFVMQPRRIRLDLVWEAASASAAVTRREDLYEIFRPWLIGSDNFTQMASLKVTRDDSSVRQIDFVTERMVDTPIQASADFPGQTSGLLQVELLCMDPIWYDPTPESLDDGGTPTFTQWNSLDVTDTTATMWPVITVVGPATSFRFDVYGVGASDGVIFTGNTINAGETITIDTRPFRRSIVDQTGADRTDLVSTFTGLELIKLHSEADADSATQYATASCSGTSGATDISWTYYKRFVAI